MSKQMYELTIVYKPISKDAEGAAEEVGAGVVSIIEKLGGKVNDTEDWGRKWLAYPIQKLKEGYFVHYVIDFPKDSVEDLRVRLKHEKNVLRWLLVLAE